MTAVHAEPAAEESRPDRGPLASGATGWAQHWRDRIEAEPARAVTLAAVGLALAQLMFRGWLCLRGWFVGDDFAFIGHANTMPLWSHEYLIKDYNSHFMPGAFLVVRVLNALWPLNFVPVAILSIALMAAIDVAVFALARELFGLRPAILLPFAAFLFTPLTLPSFLWWSAALNQLPQQLAMASAFFLHARYLRTGRLRYGLGGAGCVVGGLAFSEKTILVIPLLVAFTLLFCVDGGLFARAGVGTASA